MAIGITLSATSARRLLRRSEDALARHRLVDAVDLLERALALDADLAGVRRVLELVFAQLSARDGGRRGAIPPRRTPASRPRSVGSSRAATARRRGG
jgi:hypothetical protein